MTSPLDAAIADSAAYLRSGDAARSLARDPYWPKWHAPWWHLLALEEAGRLDVVPAELPRALMERTRDHFVPFFPASPAELPAGKDFWLHVVCHCALASLLRVLLALGLDGEEGIPWARGWLLRYQLPDGGWNCDERAYTKREPRSSLVSTLPPLEWLLAAGERRALSPEERAALDRGAAYVLAHQVVCSARTGELLRPEWLVPSRPRFYEYDALRGLRFLTRWAERRRRPIPRRAITLAVAALERRLGPGAAAGAAARRWHATQETRLAPAPGPSGWGPVTTFPLLEALSSTAAEGALIEAEWAEARAALARLERDGLVE